MHRPGLRCLQIALQLSSKRPQCALDSCEVHFSLSQRYLQSWSLVLEEQPWQVYRLQRCRRDIEDRRSTSRYVFLINGADVSWRSKKQSCVALSTAEAALASAAQEAMWIRQLTQDLKDGSDRATVIYEDNQAVISMAQNPHFHGRAKVPFCASAGSKRNSGT